MKTFYCHKLSHIRPFIVAVLAFVSLGAIILQLPYQPSDFTPAENCTKNSTSESNYTKGTFFDKCSEKWPDLDLFLTVPSDATGEMEYRNIFLPSLSLFWPKKYIKFVIVTDAEADSAPEFANRAIDLAEKTIGVQMRAVFTRRVFDCPGWHKSQWLKFWADNFTTSEYVGFVDSDTLFVTRVALHDLFVDGKPIVKPIYGKPKTADPNYWSRAPHQTFIYTGYKEPFNCMTYFPVIVKTAHLRYIREEIRKRMNENATFDEVFHHIVHRNYYSEYNIMCAYMWYVFRDDYFWVINESEVGWSGYVPGQISNFEEANITQEHLRPRPHVSIHPGHGEPYDGALSVMRRGVCFSMTDQEQRPAYCPGYPNRTLSLNSYEFQFETDDFSQRPGAFEAHLQRLADNDECPHEWSAARLVSLE